MITFNKIIVANVCSLPSLGRRLRSALSPENFSDEVLGDMSPLEDFSNDVLRDMSFVWGSSQLASWCFEYENHTTEINFTEYTNRSPFVVTNVKNEDGHWDQTIEWTQDGYNNGSHTHNYDTFTLKQTVKLDKETANTYKDDGTLDRVPEFDYVGNPVIQVKKGDYKADVILELEDNTPTNVEVKVEDAGGESTEKSLRCDWDQESYSFTYSLIVTSEVWDSAASVTAASIDENALNATVIKFLDDNEPITEIQSEADAQIRIVKSGNESKLVILEHDKIIEVSNYDSQKDTYDVALYQLGVNSGYNKTRLQTWQFDENHETALLELSNVKIATSDDNEEIMALEHIIGANEPAMWANRESLNENSIDEAALKAHLDYLNAHDRSPANIYKHETNDGTHVFAIKEKNRIFLVSDYDLASNDPYKIAIYQFNDETEARTYFEKYEEFGEALPDGNHLETFERQFDANDVHHDQIMVIDETGQQAIDDAIQTTQAKFVVVDDADMDGCSWEGIKDYLPLLIFFLPLLILIILLKIVFKKK